MVPTDEIKEIKKKFEELCTKIRDLIRSKTNYDKNYMKTQLNSDEYLAKNKMLELYNMIILVRIVFYENN